MFDVHHLNVKCQNDLNVKLFDVEHSHVKCQSDMNVERQLVLTFDIRMSKVK